jgi:hypothetical protein
MKTNIFTLILILSFSGSVFSQVVINDQYFQNQWYLNMPGDENTRADIRVLEAWARTMGSTIKIADIEDNNGLYPNTLHEDLIDRITTQSPSSLVGEHATNIAGLLVAIHNSIGIAGVNKFAHLYSYYYDNYDQWADKVRDARLDGNKIINISQGTTDALPQVYTRLAEAYSNNNITVVSVGNSTTNITYPAVYQGVIAVGSSTKDNTSSTWSNYGAQIEFLAPGGTDFTQTNPKNIFTTLSNGSYGYAISGTSLAAPLVSGAASLLLAYEPDLTNEDVKNILIYSCDKLQEMLGANFTNKCGYGRINLEKAMELLEPPYVLTHGNATLTEIADVEKRTFFENPILGSGVYFVDMYKLSIDRDDLDYLEPPKAWLPVGYSGAEPNYSQEWMNVTTTSTSVHALTFFYYVKESVGGTPIYKWFPYNPSQYYTILGKPAMVNVTLTTAQFPEGAGSGGTYEVNGVNVGPTYNGTIHSGQSIRAIPPLGAYFCKWSDSNISNPRTIIGNVNIYAIYKGTQLSNDQNAYKNNSQRKFVRTPNGYMYFTYESMGYVWLERSTDGGSTWDILNNGKPLGNTLGKSPSMDYSPSWNFIVITYLQQESGNNYKLVYTVYNSSGFICQSGDVEWDVNPMAPYFGEDAQAVVAWNGNSKALFATLLASPFLLLKLFPLS